MSSVLTKKSVNSNLLFKDDENIVTISNDKKTVIPRRRLSYKTNLDKTGH